MLNPAFLFSYWIFAWFVAFMLGWTQRNPFLWLALALLLNIVQLGVMYFHYQNSALTLTAFTLVTVVLKVVPLTIFWIQKKATVAKEDAIFGLQLFAVYVCFLFFTAWREGGGDLQKAWRDMDMRYRRDQMDTPLVVVLKTLWTRRYES